jgi:hypothetical protein
MTLLELLEGAASQRAKLDAVLARAGELRALPDAEAH